MSNDGASFEIDLPVTGKETIDAASLSVDALSSKLDLVSKAAKAAGGEVSAAEKSYRQAEQSVDRAAKALEKLGVAAELQRGKLKAATDAGDTKSAERATKVLEELAKRQATATDTATKAQAALVAEATALDKLKASASKAADAEKALAKAVEDKKKADEKAGQTKDATKDLLGDALGKSLGKLGPVGEKVGGVVSSLVTGFGKLGKTMADVGPEGAAVIAMAAVAASVVLVTAAILAATVAMATWSVGLADTNRQSRLLAQGMVQSSKGGIELDASIKSIARTLPISNEELSTLAKNFAYAGYRGKDLTNAIQQSATWAARLKFGPNFREEMLSLDEQSKVLHANLLNVFGGLKIDGLLGAVQKLIALFDDTTASGRAIKTIFESLFQPLIDGVTGSQFTIEAFFLKLEVWSLKALIVMKEHWGIVKALFIGVAATAGGFLLAALASLLPIVFSLGAAVLAATWPFLAIGAAIGAVAVGIYELISHWEAMKTFFSGVGHWASDIASSIVDGLVNGLLNGASAVLEAMKALILHPVDAVKDFLGIHSPSKLFMDIGMNTGAGMEIGVDRSTAGVQDSLENMIQPPSPSGAGGASGSSASASSKGSIDLSGAHFVFQGVKDAEDAETRFGALLTRLLEGDTSQLGATVPG